LALAVVTVVTVVVVPERLRGVITTRLYTNPRLPLPYLPYLVRKLIKLGLSSSSVYTHECSMNNKIHDRAHTIIQKDTNNGIQIIYQADRREKEEQEGFIRQAV